MKNKHSLWFFALKELLQDMLKNQVCSQPKMTIKENSDMLTKGLQCLVTHFMCAIQSTDRDNKVLALLFELTQARQTFGVSL